jgi:hypothetical protein
MSKRRPMIGRAVSPASPALSAARTEAPTAGRALPIHRNIDFTFYNPTVLTASRQRAARARMLLPLISPALQVLVILLVAIVALYVVVVLLGFVGIHVPVPGFR